MRIIMLPQDIRIGNLVYDSLRNKEVKIELKHFRELAISEKAFFERYRGIELTEDKLLAFGFERIRLYNFFIKLKNEEYLSLFPMTSGGEFNGMWGINAMPQLQKKLECFHQLQNLHFSLTNEELPIAQ